MHTLRMGENAPGYRSGPAGPDIYWRRRAIALAIGLAVFAIVAWAVNGTFSVPTTAHTTSLTKNASAAGGGQGGSGHGGVTAAGGARSSRGPGSGSSSNGSASHGTASKGKSESKHSKPGSGRNGPAGRHGASGTASGHGGRGAAAGTRTHQSGQGHGSGFRLAACSPGKLILGLRQPRATYPRHVWPRFAAYVVSTAARPCTFDIGAGSVGVSVRAAGRPLWRSSACTTGTKPTVLTQGVPAVLHFRWDRRVQRPGCHGQGRLVRPGTFVATAVSGTLASKPLIFVLAAPGVAVP